MGPDFFASGAFSSLLLITLMRRAFELTSRQLVNSPWSQNYSSSSVDPLNVLSLACSLSFAQGLYSSSLCVLEASRSSPCGQATVVSVRKPRMAFVALGSPNNRSSGVFSAEGIFTPAFRKALAMVSLGLRHSLHSNKRWRTDSSGAWHP